MKVLVINPGGTSTKISVFQDENEILKKYNPYKRRFKNFSKVFDEYDYRKQLIVDILSSENHSINSFDAVVGRGGLMKAIKGGTYTVSEEMIEDMRNEINGEHASNLGALLAKTIADEIGVQSFVVDPVSVDEFDDVSRITGISDIEKQVGYMH